MKDDLRVMKIRTSIMKHTFSKTLFLMKIMFLFHSGGPEQIINN